MYFSGVDILARKTIERNIAYDDQKISIIQAQIMEKMKMVNK